MDAILNRFKSKTYWAAVVGALVLVVDQNSGFFSGFMPAEYRSIAVMMWPVMMIFLREVTTTALSDKGGADASQ